MIFVGGKRHQNARSEQVVVSKELNSPVISSMFNVPCAIVRFEIWPYCAWVRPALGYGRLLYCCLNHSKVLRMW